MQSWLNSKGRAGECWTQRLLGSSIASPHILILWPAVKKNIIIKSYAYLWKYVTKIVNSLTLSQLDSGWWSSARKCKEWKWGRWKGAWETSIRLMKSTSQMHNSQQLACFLTLLNWTFISVKYDPSKIVSILKKPKSIETFSIFYHILYTCPVNSQPSQNLVSLIDDKSKSSQLGR